MLAVLVFSYGCSKPPADEQIKRDLAGKTLSRYDGKVLWKFDAASGFGDFRIIDKRERNELLQYTIQSTLIDLSNHSRYATEFIVSYKKARNRKWEIVHLYARRFAAPGEDRKPPL